MAALNFVKKAQRPDVHPLSGPAIGARPRIGAFRNQPADPDQPHSAKDEPLILITTGILRRLFLVAGNLAVD